MFIFDRTDYVIPEIKVKYRYIYFHKVTDRSHPSCLRLVGFSYLS